MGYSSFKVGLSGTGYMWRHQILKFLSTLYAMYAIVHNISLDEQLHISWEKSWRNELISFTSLAKVLFYSAPGHGTSKIEGYIGV